MAMGRSKKPCIGCGKLPEKHQDSWSADKPLCEDCCNAIKHYEGLTWLLKRFTKKKGSLVALRVPEEGRSHDLPYVPNDHEPFKMQSDHFRPAFHALALACSEPAPSSEGTQERLIQKGQDGWGEARLFPVEIVAPLRKLYEEALWLANNNHADGFKDGSNMLKQLMSGEIKNEEINERVAKDKG